MDKKPFFEECKVWWWDGYYIPVRNSMNHHLEKEHISEEDKALYEKEFGEKVLYDHEFLDWYINILKSKTD